MKKFIIVLLSFIFINDSLTQDLKSLAITTKTNREFSYTDKKFGYFYGATHTKTKREYFTGWNINMKRVLYDYALFINKKVLNRKNCTAKVFPHKLERYYKNCVEELFLFDDKPILCIKINTKERNEIGIKILSNLDTLIEVNSNGFLFKPKESEEGLILLSPINEGKFFTNNDILNTNSSSKGFVFIFGKDKSEINFLLNDFRKNHVRWLSERESRMSKLISETNYFKCDNEIIEKGVKWLKLTTDQLIMNQLGWGIYAGLPWFNDYWGRDLFIAFPGACLVTGQFEVAKKILLSFSKFQNNDINSKYYGRLPNRARPDEIIYNSVDGTPRLLIAIYEYVKYTGDTTIVKELYPVIKKAIEGVEKYWIDEKGYLTHDDADTWMDAKEKGIRPYSPRDNRANDIQALWFNQLKISAFFAHLMNDYNNFSKWDSMANNVKKHFLIDFIDDKYNYIADRITLDNNKDFKLRPNQLFALDLIDDEHKRLDIIKIVWSKLTYPWGVASLYQLDEEFHPYHEYWHYYHKDEAYHNGTVWLWLNGIAMQKMIEYSQKEKAFTLFLNMMKQALFMDAVGSLPENFDALPRKGKSCPNSSGTFLQAWSNAEHLRVWYEYFLGIKPNLINNEISINPNIPEIIKEVNYSLRIGSGLLECNYDNKNKYFKYKLLNISAKIKFSLDEYNEVEIELLPGFYFEVRKYKTKLNFKIFNYKNELIKSFDLLPDMEKLKIIKWRNLFFKNINFCKPYLKKGLKCLSVFHKKAIEY